MKGLIGILLSLLAVIGAFVVLRYFNVIGNS